MTTDRQESTHPRENTLRLVSEDEATGRTERIYRDLNGSRGDVDEDLDLSKLWLLFGNDPGLMERVWAHIDYVYNGGSLPYELKSKISMVVATEMECEGCRYFHESALGNIGVDDDVIAGLMERRIEETGLSPEEEILKFAQRTHTTSPMMTSRHSVNSASPRPRYSRCSTASPSTSTRR